MKEGERRGERAREGTRGGQGGGETTAPTVQVIHSVAPFYLMTAIGTNPDAIEGTA